MAKWPGYLAKYMDDGIVNGEMTIFLVKQFVGGTMCPGPLLPTFLLHDVKGCAGLRVKVNQQGSSPIVPGQGSSDLDRAGCFSNTPLEVDNCYDVCHRLYCAVRQKIGRWFPFVVGAIMTEIAEACQEK